MTLSPGQKKLLKFGLPVVAVLGIIMLIRSRSSSSGSSASTTSGTTTTGSGDDAIGLDQMAAFENEIESELGTLTTSPAGSTQSSGTTTASAPPVKAPTPPTPGSSVVDVNSADFPTVVGSSTPLSFLGKIVGGGGLFEGENVAGGAPVYADVHGTWEQDFNVNALPVGTELATLSQFAGNIVPGSKTEHL